ncbi:hypothetical protein Poli38472_006226 [Pythium oligandrum]|uniref:Uncharacterized protein n=1 Tax=Pythium oligandrum TaxID=41045 RepID=A0A8K1FSP6_PYTOL|nr:hypothetical protein Poli38472_006226 [Pythium oligandrum]|eukprot:TMW68758.1 hypothetical protein Poli38472_006226 [Pythium oligandrum]
MNPEVEDAVLTSTPTKAASLSPMTRPNALRKSQVFQRRLKAKITESRMLELLDRQLEQDRTGQSVLDSNQDGEDELVCDSTMVRLEGPATPDAFDQRVR